MSNKALCHTDFQHTLAGTGPSVRTITVLQLSPSPEKPGAATESTGARKGSLLLAGAA